MVAKRQANGVTDVGTARRQARTGSGGAQVVLHEPKVDGRNVVRAHRVRGRTAGPAPVPHAATPAARSLSSGQRHAQPARALERCLSMLRPAAPPSVPHPPRQPDHSNLSLPVLVTKSTAKSMNSARVIERCCRKKRPSSSTRTVRPRAAECVRASRCSQALPRRPCSCCALPPVSKAGPSFGLGGRGLPHAESLTCACPRPLPAPDPSLKLARREDIPAARVPSAHAGEKLANRARRRAICGARADYESRSTAGDHP